MANDNETVEKVALSDRPLAEQIRIIRGNYCIGSGEFDALDEAADVVECHKREIGELKGERKGILKANESFASDNTWLRGELAAKDAEIERLRAALKPVLECDCWIFETAKSRATDGATDAIKAVKEAQRIYKEVKDA